MSWEKRSIDLDSLQAPEGHVLTGLQKLKDSACHSNMHSIINVSLLTGIRFQEVGTHLNMEIMVTPVVFHKGSLKRPTELSYWIGNANTDSALESPR